jgi:hypothetical protein
VSDDCDDAALGVSVDNAVLGIDAVLGVDEPEAVTLVVDDGVLGGSTPDN